MATEIISKRCSKCKDDKYAAQKRYLKTKKGKAARKRYQQSKKGKAANRKGLRKYFKTEKGKATYKAYYKTDKGKAIRRAARKRFYIRYPNRLKAKGAVSSAIRVGKLPHPDTLQCYYCPESAKQYHHWHGYKPEHWLDVVPICQKCHPKLRVKFA